MGFGAAMKAANNAWAWVSCEDGVGYLSPENLIDNRAHRLVIAIGTRTVLIEKKDIKSIDLICATSEWVKYAIVLKNNNKRYIATFIAFTVDQKGKKPSMSLLNFEWWFADLMYKEKTGYSTTVPVAPMQQTGNVLPVNASLATSEPATKETEKKTTTVKKSTATKKTAGKVESVQATEDEEKEKQYLFAVQMLNMRSYTVAYNTLSKIKGYKDVDALLAMLEEKI